VSTLSENDPQKHAVIDAINLALKSAQNKSRRAGIGWAILDDQGSLLTHGSIIAGIETERPSLSVARYQNTIHHLILTTEPSPGFFSASSLIKQLSASSCSKITIAHRLDDDVVDAQWREWTEAAQDKFDYRQVCGIAQSLCAGIVKVRREQRPWVTVVSAADLERQSKPLINMIEEFGFKAYLSNLVGQNRAYLVEPHQVEILEHLPEDNNMEELIEIYELPDIRTTQTLLNYCATENRGSVLLSCSLDFLEQLVEADLADEIIHHIDIDTTQGPAKIEAPLCINLESWSLISSSAVGTAIRMRFKKKDDIAEPYSILGNGFN